MSDQNSEAGPRATRRSFLKVAGLASAAASAPGLGAMTATEAQALTAPSSERAPRYQETDHVRKFYETNRR
jgi:hypothetical protein